MEHRGCAIRRARAGGGVWAMRRLFSRRDYRGARVGPAAPIRRLAKRSLTLVDIDGRRRCRGHNTARGRDAAGIDPRSESGYT